MGNRQESGVRITGHNIKNPGDHSPGLPYLLHCRNIDQCQFFNICIFKTGDQRLSGIDRCQYIDPRLNSVSSDDKSVSGVLCPLCRNIDDQIDLVS